jgi:hypothetical protein
MSLRDGFSDTMIPVRASEHAPILTDWWSNCGIEKQAEFIEAVAGQDAIEIFLAKFADDMGYAAGSDILHQGGGVMPYPETPNPTLSLVERIRQNPVYSATRDHDVSNNIDRGFLTNEQFDATSNFSTGTTAP